MQPDHRHPYGVIRREFLQVGFSGFLGLGTSGLLAGAARGAGAATVAKTPRARSMIVVFLTGAPSQIDTFDPKPDAPDGIRSEFASIETRAPGLRFCEHLPRLAGHADKLAVIRSMAHSFTNHLNGTHELLTGHSQPGAFFDKIASRDDYPCYAAALDYLKPRADGIPTGVMLPTFLMEGPLVWPGQHAGFLGPKHDPWQIRQDPNDPRFHVDDLSMPVGFSVERMNSRRSLLSDLSAQRDALEARPTSDPLAKQRDLAYALLLSGKVGHAFDLGREDPKIRDRYGRHPFGQSLLLARRLVQAGVPIVQANMGKVQSWDHHGAIFKTLRDRMLPPLDQALDALFEDLHLTGLLDETLVVITGEFGRTPKIGVSGGAKVPGRDHWSSVFSTVLAGAGIQGGQAIGASDRIGAYPASRPYSPGDLAATIYGAFGIDPATELRDRLGRPIQLARGEVIAPLYSAAEVA
jgi:hypothetical protein